MDGWWEIDGLDIQVWLQPRPKYCDRGNFLANVDLRPTGRARRANLDAHDGWPRYYMDFDRAKLEIEAWLKKRKQWIDS